MHDEVLADGCPVVTPHAPKVIALGWDEGVKDVLILSQRQSRGPKNTEDRKKHSYLI
jgi:hypothetical protein